MQNKKAYIIGLLFLVLAVCVILFGEPRKTTRDLPKTTEQTFDPEALAIRDKLYAKSKEYGAKTKRQNDLQDEIARLTEDVAILEREKGELAVTASSYDHILCADYGLKYNRPVEAGSGSLVTAGACDSF